MLEDSLVKRALLIWKSTVDCIQSIVSIAPRVCYCRSESPWVSWKQHKATLPTVP